MLLDGETFRRSKGGMVNVGSDEKMNYYIEQYVRSGIADVVILPYLNEETVTVISGEHLKKLAEIVNGMLAYKSFEVISVHDEFKCHANNMNYLRQQYVNILCDLAESDLIGDLLGQIHGKTGTYTKKSQNLSKLMKNANYALC